MIIANDDELQGLKEIGRLCGLAVKTMAASLEPGITTRELDLIGRKVLEDAGAQSAPELCYKFPGATCISVNEEVAHGIPGDRVIKPGDLVNIDVSAEKNGFFGDTGASFLVPPGKPKTERLLRDGKRALFLGIQQVKAGFPFAGIGRAIGAFADSHRYTLIENLASHGVGRSLHEEPRELSTWADPDETRIMAEGQVFTIEPFLSLGGQWAEDGGGDDQWTLYSEPRALTVQFEHTVVATKSGPLILTLVE
ncbi:type I methionyl aminopeptidase [Allorhizobium terrae]|uniref:Methionine aminopeptidase n=1 Tax=Allorhizobium terrae TaxID=1848972 RepID=A0A4S4A5C9_9HYPH|nr:type I methionyl aminopeptidase [Allorhizobium terrae]THF53728.1 type I methionyl aminopeptidase [Allorhizobium terrae]TWD54293.1 methionine aminopeptidase type I [Agrobacterium vitis]